MQISKIVRISGLSLSLGMAFSQPLTGQDACATGSGIIVGRVIDSDGRGVSNEFVRWGRHAEGFCGTQTDQDGRFRLIGMNDGVHFLEVNPDYRGGTCIAPQFVSLVDGGEKEVIFQRVDAPPHAMYMGIPGLSWAVPDYRYWKCRDETEAARFEAGLLDELPERHATPQEVRNRILAIDGIKSIVRGSHPDEVPVPLCDHYGGGLSGSLTIAGAKYDIGRPCEEGAFFIVQNLAVNQVRVHVGYMDPRGVRYLSPEDRMESVEEPVTPLGFQLEWDRVSDAVTIVDQW